MADDLRYARQAMITGAEGEARLRAAHVLIVGAGGLGVPALQYLVGAGVGRITLIDPDMVEETNLHRQPIYGRHIGAFKADAAAEEMRVLNPSVQVTAVVAQLDPSNAGMVAGVDVVLDCADSFAASYTLSDACLSAQVPLISASVLGMAGYVGGFCGGAPSLRALFPDLPDSTATCATAGVLGPMVGLLGAAQAQMALAVLLGLTPSPLGQLLRFDGLRPSTFRFDGAPEITGHRFIARSDLNDTDLIVELRGTDEAPVPITPTALRQPAAIRPRDGQRTVFACRSGLRAWRAADALAARWSGEIVLLAAGDSA